MPRHFGVAIPPNGDVVPEFLVRVVPVLVERGLIPGIFRNLPHLGTVESLRQQFEDDATPPALEDVEPDVLAELLKQWLRDLPEPLLTYQMYNVLVRAGSEPSLIEVRKMLADLPRGNQVALSYLFAFFTRVAAESQVTQMTPTNIAVVMGPVLLHPEEETPQTILHDSSTVHRIIRILVDNFDYFFLAGASEELLAQSLNAKNKLISGSSHFIRVNAGEADARPRRRSLSGISLIPVEAPLEKPFASRSRSVKNFNISPRAPGDVSPRGTKPLSPRSKPISPRGKPLSPREKPASHARARAEAADPPMPLGQPVISQVTFNTAQTVVAMPTPMAAPSPRFALALDEPSAPEPVDTSVVDPPKAVPPSPSPVATQSPLSLSQSSESRTAKRLSGAGTPIPDKPLPAIPPGRVPSGYSAASPLASSASPPPSALTRSDGVKSPSGIAATRTKSPEPTAPEDPPLPSQQLCEDPPPSSRLIHWSDVLSSPPLAEKIDRLDELANMLEEDPQVSMVLALSSRNSFQVPMAAHQAAARAVSGSMNHLLLTSNDDSDLFILPSSPAQGPHLAPLGRRDSISELPANDLIPPLIIPALGFKIEAGNVNYTVEQQIPFVVIDQEKNFPHFESFFLGRDHTNFVASESETGPVIISVENRDNAGLIKVLIRTPGTYEIFAVPPKIRRPADLTKALKVSHPQIATAQFREIRERTGDSELCQALLTYEQRNVFPNLKFGVLYRKPGQTNEDDMFANNETSPEFEQFLNFLGDKVTLKNFMGYKGGLDSAKDHTGTHSIYTKFSSFEIMYHVSTMLPFYPNDKQQLERKRHLGNDIVVIVFQDADEPLDPSWMRSEFNHVYCVVTPVEGGKKYKVCIALKEAVPRCGPFLPSPSVFTPDDTFRQFFLTKLINLERVALYAPAFADKLERTRTRLLQSIISTYCGKGAKGGMRQATMPRLKEGLSGFLLKTKTFTNELKSSGEVERSASPGRERAGSPSGSQILGTNGRSETPSPPGSFVVPSTVQSAQGQSAQVIQSPYVVGSSPVERAVSPLVERNHSTSPALSSSPVQSISPPHSPRDRDEPPAVSKEAAPASPTPSTRIARSDSIDISTSKEMMRMTIIRRDTHALARDIRPQIDQLLGVLEGNLLQSDTQSLQQLANQCHNILENQIQEFTPALTVVYLVTSDPFAPKPKPDEIEEIRRALTKVLDLHSSLDSQISNTVVSSDANRIQNSFKVLQKVILGYIDSHAQSEAAERDKVGEVQATVIEGARECQKKILALQVMLRKKEVSAALVAPLLKEVGMELSLNLQTPLADAVLALQNLQKNVTATKKEWDTKKAIQRCVELGQVVRSVRKLLDFPEGFTISNPSDLDLTPADTGMALDRATREIDYLQEELQHANSLEEAVAIAKMIRHIKRFLKGENLLGEIVARPYHSDTRSPLQAEAQKLRSLKEVTRYGMMEIRSKLQHDSLQIMKVSEESFGYDAMSLVEVFEAVRSFVNTYRLQEMAPPPVSRTASRSDKMAAGSPRVDRKPSESAITAASSSTQSSSSHSAADIASKDDATKVVLLRKAIETTLTEVSHGLNSLKMDTHNVQDVEAATTIAKVAVLLRKIMGGQIRDKERVEVIARPAVGQLDPVRGPETPSRVTNLRAVALQVFDETRGFLLAQKKLLYRTNELSHAMDVARTMACIRRAVDKWITINVSLRRRT